MSNNIEYEDSNWFYLDNRRAMISLGPLNQYKTCPYNCSFCYVQDGFVPYIPKENSEIVDFLLRHNDEYDIIYVSGDTDSFAPPRRSRGLELLQSIAENIDVDLLFTTRTIFTDTDIKILHSIVNLLKSKGHYLYACISITRFSDNVAYLEPKPIPHPKERIETIKLLHNIGAVTILALRPLIPVVDINDYFTILKLSDGYVDIVLGEIFYFKSKGKIQERVFPSGIPNNVIKNLKKMKMDFNENDDEWLVWDDEYTAQVLKAYCDSHDIVFSMRSTSAIMDYKKKHER